MSQYDLSWMKAPARLEVTNTTALALPANTPMGHRGVEVDKVFEDIGYLPAVPHLSGKYIYVDLIYPALQLSFSVFELYHAETNKSLRPKLYITPEPVVGVIGTNFAQSKNAHRLIWINDDVEAQNFVDFMTSYLFTRTAKKEASGLEAGEQLVRYPIGDGVERKISCTYLSPFSTRGGYSHDAAASALSPYPMFSWQLAAVHPAAKMLQTQAEALWQSC